MGFFARLWRDRKGAVAIEYGLIVTLVVVAMIAALGSVANATTNMWNYVEDEVTSV